MQFTSTVPLNDFGINVQQVVEAFPEDHEHMAYVPRKKELYHFRVTMLRRFTEWMYNPEGDACLLVGPTGSGKTSLVEQIAARLRWPTITVSAHSRMEMPELTGYNLPYTDPVSGDLQTRFVDGPLTKAMREGFIFVLDEYDTLDPAVSVGLHAVLEGRPLVIPENGGEIIHPHPNFRFVACGNTAGQGDENSLYAATMQQNLATLDRFRVYEVPYIDKKDELALLAVTSPDLGDVTREAMVEIATSIRNRHEGKDGGNFLSVTMSTRTLLRWGRIACAYMDLGEEAPLKTALEEALLNRCDAVQRLAINQIAKSVIGNTWDEN